MTDATLTSTTPSLTSDSVSRIDRVYLVTGLCIAIAHAGLLFKLGKRLWAAEHYQFFPLILVGFAFLVYSEAQRKPLANGSHPYVRVLLASFAWLLLLIAAVVNSPWLAGIAGMAAMLAVIHAWGGASATRRLFPAWLFLGIAIPLPLGLDERLIQALQHLATHWASGVLDLLGVRHLIGGVVVYLPERTYLVEEACSGIHSLFAVVACAAFYSIYARRHWLRLVAIILIAVFWVLVANTVRVAAVTVLSSRWDLPVTEGLGHELVGILVFLLSLGLVWSSDQLLLFVLPKRQPKSLLEVRDQRNRKARRRPLVPKLRLGTHRMGGSAARRDEANPSHSASSTRAKRSLVPRLRLGTHWMGGSAASRDPNSSRSSPSRREALTWSALFGAIAVLQWTSPLWANRHAADVSLASRSLSRIPPDRLPDQLLGWQRFDFRSVTRDPEDPNGNFSQIWYFERQGRRAAISIDGPFVGWHNLAGCLQGQGWRVTSSRHQPYRELGESLPGGFTELQLEKGIGEWAFVNYGVFDEQLRPAEPPQSYVGFRAIRRFPSLFAGLKRLAGGQAPGEAPADSRTYQLQLYAESHAPWSESDLLDLRALFHEIRKRLTAP